MASAESNNIAGISVNNIAMLSSVTVFIGAIIVVGISWGLSNDFAGINATDVLTTLFMVMVLSCIVGIAVGLLLKAKTAKIAAQLNVIHETLSLLIAKRYEKVEEQLQTITEPATAPELTSIGGLLTDLAVSTASIDEQAARRVRDCYSQTDALRHQLEHVRRLISNAQMLIMTVSPRLEVAFFNRYAEKITGVAANEIINIGVGNLFSSTDWRETERHYKALLAGDIKMAHQETEIIDGEGQIRNIWWLHSMLDDAETKQILSVGHDITDEKGVEKRVVWLSNNDALTGLVNAVKFQDIFVENLNNALRYEKHHTLQYLHFDFPMYQKLDNHLTQQMTDEMRVAIADALQQLIRQTDTLARVNEHDFAILQPETTDEGRQRFTEKLLTRMAELNLTTPKKNLPVCVHIGVIDYPYENADANELFAFAELAAVRAKHLDAKTSGYHVFEPNEQTANELKDRVFWKKRIQSALQKEQFVVHYQPIIALNAQRIVGYEGFLRLLDEETGEALPAGKFIEIAEKQGLIEEIDQFVLKQIFAKAAASRESMSQQLFAINISKLTLEPNKLLPHLKKLLSHFKLSGRQIIIEVSEDIAIDHTDALKLLMTAVKQLDIRFALDDFGFDGTLSKYGFSSFSLLQQLPVDFVKINSRFVRDLHNNTHDQLFVKALAEEAQLNGVKTIAAGVENDEVMGLLKSYGVDYAQGYFIGHPSASLQTDN
ncbi:MAG: EAL domain-containing protein [Methylophaga sp.]|nr:EAL domain-containing protein [Methylophaga sp.]